MKVVQWAVWMEPHLVLYAVGEKVESMDFHMDVEMVEQLEN